MIQTSSLTSPAEQVADWLELLCLAHDGVLAGTVASSFARDAGIAEERLAFAHVVLGRREEVLGPAYPFSLGSGVLQAEERALASPWTAMVLLSPHIRAQVGSTMADADKRFEELTAHAVGNLYGDAGRVVAFGHDVNPSRPSDFPGAIRWLAAQMGVTVGGAYRSPLRKDGGVDVVAWRPFLDRRSGFPVVLVQCTVGTDLRTKAKEIDARLWSGWLSLDTDPSTALAFPYTVSQSSVWSELSLKTTVLDRVRLMELLPEAGVAEAAKWVAAALAASREVLA